MLLNYGDRNFFEHGRLADTEHSDTMVQVLYCEPYPDEPDLYRFADCMVDLEDDQFDWEAVKKYAGMEEVDDCDEMHALLAIAAVDYYGVACFSSPFFGYDFSREEIEERLKCYLIASDNLDITW